MQRVHKVQPVQGHVHVASVREAAAHTSHAAQALMQALAEKEDDIYSTCMQVPAAKTQVKRGCNSALLAGAEGVLAPVQLLRAAARALRPPG